MTLCRTECLKCERGAAFARKVALDSLSPRVVWLLWISCLICDQ